jgi:hypothetical protein
MGRGKLATLAVRAGAMLAVCFGALLAPDADATTITLGAHEFPTNGNGYFSCNTFAGGCTGFTVAQLSTQGVPNTAPASGIITSWRIKGSGSPSLHVLEPTGEGAWAGAGATGVPANKSGGPNAASLPIRAGDLIAVDLPESGADVQWVNSSNSEVIKFEPIIEEGVSQYEEFPNWTKEEMLLGAEVVLAPVVSSISPASGVPAGGNAVKISGQYLDGATKVTFGSAPASSFSVDSVNQITAIAPASAPATVDVRVTGPGGSSEVGPADRYTFVALATTTGTGSASSLLAPPPGTGVAKPAVSGFGQSASRWRRGKGLPHIAASGAPLGTTFSFTLNEPASVSFAFTQRRPGRRVRGRCVTVTPGNAGKARCKRTVKAGSFGLPGHQGLNKASFQGRLTSSKTLKPGTYAVWIVASDAHRLRAVSPSLGFTIVAG